MKQWYYGEGGKQNGPVSQDLLVDLIKSGKLSENSYIWTQGMPEWGLISKTPFASLIPPVKPLNQGSISKSNSRQPQQKSSFGNNSTSKSPTNFSEGRKQGSNSNSAGTLSSNNRNTSSIDVSRKVNSNAKTTIYVKQKIEMLEAITGFETENKYYITDTRGSIIAEAREGSSWVARYFLKSMRPFTMSVSDNSGDDLMLIDRPFTFFLHRFEVKDGRNIKIGTVERKFSLLNKNYEIKDSTGRTILTISSPIWSPWTFKLFKNEMQIGDIKKKWSGLFKESLTDADNFAVTFPKSYEGDEYKLILAAVLLIDFVHFEN